MPLPGHQPLMVSLLHRYNLFVFFPLTQGDKLRKLTDGDVPVVEEISVTNMESFRLYDTDIQAQWHKKQHEKNRLPKSGIKDSSVGLCEVRP